MFKALSRDLEAARDAAEVLVSDFSNPRVVEGNMDILRTALLKLLPAQRAIRKKKGKEKPPGLCDVIEMFINAKLLDEDTLTCCQAIDELVQVSDYDISDEQRFADEVESEVEVLIADLEAAFTKLEDRDDEDEE